MWDRIDYMKKQLLDENVYKKIEFNEKKLTDLVEQVIVSLKGFD